MLAPSLLLFRCADPTEFSTNFSTLKRDGVFLNQKKPLEPACPWTGTDKDGNEVSIEASEVYEAMTEIGSELAVLQMSKLLGNEWMEWIVMSSFNRFYNLMLRAAAV